MPIAPATAVFSTPELVKFSRFRSILFQVRLELSLLSYGLDNAVELVFTKSRRNFPGNPFILWYNGQSPDCVTIEQVVKNGGYQGLRSTN